MEDKEQDPNLQAPQVAETTKHINFLEIEEGDDNSADSDRDNAEDDSPTKRAWEELREDENKRQSSESE